jgi:hypothetical protein
MWLVGHEVLSAPIAAGTVTSAAFIASAITTCGLCASGPRPGRSR